MLKIDLGAAGIDYRDASGLVFDFHSLRCQTATLADQAGCSPRVVQRLMRHSTLELTGRYTRPRAVDLERAASALPTLRPTPTNREALAATGTDDPAPGAITGATGDDDDDTNPAAGTDLSQAANGIIIRVSGVRVPPPLLPPVTDRSRQNPSFLGFVSTRFRTCNPGIPPVSVTIRPDPSPDCYRWCYRCVCRCDRCTLRVERSRPRLGPDRRALGATARGGPRRHRGDGQGERERAWPMTTTIVHCDRCGSTIEADGT
jgi:hypothetical protein